MIRIPFSDRQSQRHREIETGRGVRRDQEGIDPRFNSDRPVTVVMESGVAPVNLQALLLQHKPDVVHFSGHGTAQGYVLLQGQGEEALSEPVAAKGFRRACFAARYARE